MPGDDPLNNCKPNSGAGKLIGTMQALEYPEKLVRVAHVEARPIVLNEIHGLPSMNATADFDPRRCALARVTALPIRLTHT
jgi:hypothetical protein